MSECKSLIDSCSDYICEQKNNVSIVEMEDKKYVLKKDVSIDYPKLYKYLYSRGFSYVPELVEFKDKKLLLNYEEDVNLDNSLKAKDMMKVISLLHSKTSYFKEITSDTYNELYEQIEENISFAEQYYQSLYDSFLLEEMIVPSHYLFLRNYSLLYKAILYTKDKLEVWHNEVITKNKKRVSLIHNNLRLEHLLKNEEEYLISWDRYTIDSPVLDLYHFYQNEWEDIPFLELLNTYQERYKLEEDEILLFCLLISVPYKIDFEKSEYENCKVVRNLFAYLMKSSEVIAIAEKN